MTATQRFLHALFADVPEHLRFYLWSVPSKRSAWFAPSAIDAAVAHVESLRGADVYVGVGLSTRDRGANQRIESKNAAGIVGLWADVDIADEAHKKSGLPESEAKARRVLDAMGLAPSAVVHSGHGLQAWWLFAEPWVFTSTEDRTAAATLSTRWNLTLRTRAADLDCVVDSTYDLARVMRVPGTTNFKAAPVAVRLPSLVASRRYGVDDFDGYLVDGTATVLTYTVGALDLRLDAQPDVAKLDVLRENDKRFEATWQRSRRDLSDDSGSAYDLSLAALAAGVGWSDQEIANLIIASRRKHADNPEKALRQDYITRTIRKAREDAARSHSSEEIDVAREVVDVAVSAGDGRVAQRGRRELCEHLSNLFRIVITRGVRYNSDPPTYRMETTKGAVILGTAESVLSLSSMRAKIVSATNVVIPRFKGAKWDEIAQAFFSCCEDEDVGIEATDEGMAFSWLSEYLEGQPVIEDRSHAAATQSPYVENGMTYLFGPAFRRWLWLHRGERVKPGRMGEILRAYGCEPGMVNVTIENVRTTRNVWSVPGLNGQSAGSRALRRLVAVPREPEAPESPEDAAGRHDPTQAE